MNRRVVLDTNCLLQSISRKGRYYRVWRAFLDGEYDLCITNAKYSLYYSDSLSEIEVWGVDPTELECTHPDEFLTEWEAVPGTANCTEYGIDQRECTKCGTVFHRESPSMLPTGHKYETILVERGTSLAFGSGTNVCTRCGHEVAFPEPRDLVSPLGGFKTSGVVRFTDVSISSFYASWSGIPTTAILDNDWTYSWGKYWAASTKDHGSVYIDYEFAVPIDLTAIDMSVHNHDHIVEFYSLVGDEETLVGSVAIEKDASNASECQHTKVDFRGVTLSALRVRFKDSVGLNVGDWGNNVITCSELHPYGTVVGAGKSAAVRTRVIID